MGAGSGRERRVKKLDEYLPFVHEIEYISSRAMTMNQANLRLSRIH